MLTKLLSTCIIAGAFLIGCGGETKEQSSQDISMPHQIDMSPKKLRGDGPNSPEYQNYMRTYNFDTHMFYIDHNGPYGPGYIKLTDYAHQNKDLIYAFYVDADRNTQTGYVNPWLPKVGAEFLIEDGIRYKYTGTPGSNEWSWEVVDWNAGDVKQGEGIRIGGNSYPVYGVTINKDWTFNTFMGYRNLNITKKNLRVLSVGVGDRIFYVYEIDDDIYFHSYNRHTKIIAANDVYYNYKFIIGNQPDNEIQYYTEEGILFKNDGTVVNGIGNIEYEVRGYDAITIIPKSFFPVDFDFDITKEHNAIVTEVTVRDKDWNVTFHRSDF